MHKDIKLENIFVEDDTAMPNLVIGDFGYSAFRLETKLLYNNLKKLFSCGTPGYMAPEIFDKGLVDCKSDIFSAGIIFYLL